MRPRRGHPPGGGRWGRGGDQSNQEPPPPMNYNRNEGAGGMVGMSVRMPLSYDGRNMNDGVTGGKREAHTMEGGRGQRGRRLWRGGGMV